MMIVRDRRPTRAELPPLYLGTEVVGDEAAITLRQRLGRCYELSAYALALGTAPSGSMLVHGTIHGFSAPQRISHSWLVLPDATIWEPAKAQVWFLMVWETVALPIVDASYDRDTTRRMIARSGHWGPWIS